MLIKHFIATILFYSFVPIVLSIVSEISDKQETVANEQNNMCLMNSKSHCCNQNNLVLMNYEN
jgi:hypothetical protein